MQQKTAVSFNAKHLANLKAKIDKLAGSYPRAAERASRNASMAIGHMLVDELKIYPPSRPEVRSLAWKAGGGFVTDKQRRWYFLMLKHGMLDSPYRRRVSGGLAGAWNVRATKTGAIVTNKMPYAPFVQDERYQSRIHSQSGWKTAHSQWMKNFFGRPEVMRIIKESIEAIYQEKGLTY
ncbi:MAG: hypothetical protein GWN13_03975 [Phycisphaerae bacterium]|nr:hypothetical protein [Phycisphaerae bacterium]